MGKRSCSVEEDDGDLNRGGSGAWQEQDKSQHKTAIFSLLSHSHGKVVMQG